MIGNRTYTVDEINEFLDNTNFNSQQRAALAGLINAANNGETIKYDPNAKTFAHKDIHKMFAPFFGSENRASRNAPGKSINWSNRQARKNSDFHIANSAIHNFGQIVSYFKKKEEDAAAKAKDANVLYKINDPDGFYYTKDDGTVGFTYDVNNSKSKTAYSRFIEAIKYAIANGNLDTYNLKEWGGDATLGGAIDWYRGLEDQSRYDPENMWKRVESANLSEDDKTLWKILGAKFGTSKKEDTPYVPENANESVMQSMSDYGLKFEKDKDGRLKLVATTDDGKKYVTSSYFSRNVPFLQGLGPNYENGAVHNGMLYTQQELEQGYGPLATAFGSFMRIGQNNPSYEDWYSAQANTGIGHMWQSGWFGQTFDETNPGGYVKYDPNTGRSFDLWASVPDLYTNPTYLRDITSAYESKDNSDSQVIEYISGGYTNGLPNTKFRVVTKDKKNNVSYKDFDNEESMIASGLVTKKHSPYGFAASTINISKAEKDRKGRTYYKYKSVLGEEILKDASGKYFIKRNNANGGFDAKEVKDVETLLKIIQADGKGYNANQLRKTAGFKHGGTIKSLPKFYNGGVTMSSKLNEESSEGKTTDISETHAIKREGSLTSDLSRAWKEDFTQAEKLQIYAAIGDLAGIAMTFIPGWGNIAGAITGLGATGTQLAGDIKKDGLQGGDLVSAGFSALMDVGTLIPLAGTGIKAAKVTKALRAVANPIMKLFALYGVSNGVDAMGKIVRGEEVSSEDLVNVLRGISSTAIGAKMLKQKIGDTTLSKKLEDDVLKTKNANLKTKPEAEIGGKKISVDKATIEGKTKEEVENILKGKVKEELGANFKEGEHDVNLSQKFGISYDKGEYDGLKWKNLFKGKGFIQRANPKATFETPTPNSGHKWLRHFISPRIRNANIGYDYGYWKGNGRLGSVTDGQYNAAVRMNERGLGSFYNRWAAQSLLQRSAMMPGAFTNITFTNEKPTQVGFSWGRPVYGRKPSIDFYDQLSPTKGAREAFAIGPDGNPLPPRVLEAPVQGPIRNLNPEREIIRIGFDGKPVYADEIVTPKRTTNLSQWVDLYHNRNDYYKSGGKIQFAKGGKKIKKCEKPDGEGVPPAETATIDPSTVSATYTPPKQSGNLMGTWTPKAKPSIVPLLTGFAGSTAKIGANVVGLNQQKNNVDKIRPVSYTPETEYYTSSKNPYSQFFENEARRAESRTLNPISSDPLKNRAARKDSAEIARNIRMQGVEQSSKATDKSNDTLMREKRYYASNRTKLANLEAQENQQIDTTKGAYNSQHIAETIKNVGQYADDIATQWSEYAAKKNSLKQYEFNYDYSQFMQDAQNKFDEAKAAGGDNFKFKNRDEYIQGTPDLKAKYDNFRRRWSSLKKGGKVRTVEEQIRIDTARNRDKAILQLSKQAHDLLKTLLS